MAVEYKICKQCCEAVNSIYDFQEKCLRNLKNFRKILQVGSEIDDSCRKINSSIENFEDALLDQSNNTIYIIKEEEIDQDNLINDNNEEYKVEEIEMEMEFSQVNTEKLTNILNNMEYNNESRGK